MSARSQEAPSRTFRHLGVKDGLSQGQVNCLLRDRSGFLWIGTQDGLDRYDGYTFRHFAHHPGAPSGLTNNYIWCLLEDSGGHIWAGTFGGGLCRFDPETETFRAYYPAPLAQASLSENSIRTLWEYPKGTLWVGADAGLWKLEIATGKFRAVSPLANVCSIAGFKTGTLLAGAKEGLFLLDVGNERLTPVLFEEKPLPPVTSMLVDKLGGLWAGTIEGLFRFGITPGRDTLLPGRLFSKRSGFLPSNMVNALYHTESDPGQGTEEALWVGTFEGLVRVDTGLSVEFIRREEGNAGSLSSNIVNCLLEVQPGLMWAGTRDGINLFSLPSPPFLTLGVPDGLCGNFILGIKEDLRGHLWLATRFGLTRIDGPEVECLSPHNVPSMPFEYAINLFPVSADSNLVVFRQNGFAWLTRGPKGQWHFSRIRDLDELIRDRGITTVAPDAETGVFWVGTPGMGLVRWNSLSGAYKDYSSELPHPYVFCLLEDSRKQFWIGTANGGLCRMDRKTETFTCYTSSPEDSTGLSGNMVLSLFEDSRRRLWVCTANGLNLWEGEGRFRRFFQEDGLPNNVVYGMLEDESGNLWVSTNRGLCRIGFDGKKLAVTQFHTSDGLPGEEFNQYAFHRSQDGRMYFGSPEGLTIFRPSSIRPYPVAPKVVLTEFRLFNHPASLISAVPDAGDFSLLKPLHLLDEIVLRHDQNFIEFGISALGFAQPEHNQYAYKLEGVDENWVYCGSRRFAGYPNLPPGRYRFLAKAANHDGVWNEEPVAIGVWIKPPWWRTPGAYLVYLAVLIALVWALFRWRMEMVRRVERAKLAEREAIRKRVARDFHDEAGNKITKMALLAEVARRNIDAPERLRALLGQMEENVQELRTGMRDFIWTLDPEKDNLFDTLLRIMDFAHGMFSYSDIRFASAAPDELLRQVSIAGNRRRHFILLFKEAVNNCLKYSGASEAHFSIRREGGMLLLEFRDNGGGFDPRSASEGNGLKNMASRAEKIGGNLTIDSAPGKGTAIRLEYPLEANHPKG